MKTIRYGTVLLVIYCSGPLTAQTRSAAAAQTFQRGGAEYLKGNFTAAESLFRQAAQLDPVMVDAHEYLGHSLFKQERYRDAIPVYQKALKLDSKRVLPLDRRRALIDQLGMAYGISGDLQTAVEFCGQRRFNQRCSRQ